MADRRVASSLAKNVRKKGRKKMSKYVDIFRRRRRRKEDQVVG